MKTSRLDKYGKINRNKILSFRWDKKKYKGFEGDTLASALLANNIGIVGRSFKYHRPRGILSSGPDESGAYPVVAYNYAFGMLIIIEILFFSWMLLNIRRLKINF